MQFKYSRLSWILILLVGFSNSILANSLSNSSVDTIPTQLDILILEDINHIDFLGENFNNMLVYVSREVRYKINQLSAIDKVNEVIIPEPFDKSYIGHFAPVRNHTFAFSDLKCDSFKVLIRKPDGTEIIGQFDHEVEDIDMLMVERLQYGSYKKWHYHLNNLEVGDEVSIKYIYNVPFKENFFQLSSSRIFFNSDLYRENYQLNISHPKLLAFDLTCENGAEMDSNYIMEDTKHYEWNFTQLSGCIDEVGAKPYTSLPNIIFSAKPNAFQYKLPNSPNREFLPFYSIFSLLREKRHFATIRSIDQQVNTRQLKQLYRFVREQSEGLENDSLGVKKLHKINNTIVDEFSFKNDLNYYKGIERRDAKMGDNLTSRNLRDISRYELYVALIKRLDLDYFATYVCDNRVGELNMNYFSNMYEGDYLLCALDKNNKMHYIYPKKSDFGYYLDEMPFYFENSLASLVHMSDYATSLKAVKNTLRQVVLPKSGMKDNYRKSSVKVKVNLDTLVVDFEANVRLKGQYSTLTRGLYSHDYKDETVNELYNKKLWEIQEDVQLVKQSIEVKKKVFPYTTSIKATYKSKSVLEKVGDKFELNLENWFNHIGYEHIDVNGRQQDYYTDFLGKDNYSYFIEFNKDITLLDDSEPVKIVNELGSLMYDIQQVKPNVIRVTSIFNTLNHQITKEKVADVEEIFTALQKLNHSKIKISLAN